LDAIVLLKIFGVAHSWHHRGQGGNHGGDCPDCSSLNCATILGGEGWVKGCRGERTWSCSAL